MKNLTKLIVLSTALLLGACNAPERTIGFVTGENSDLQWHLGTQDATDVVTTVDLALNSEYNYTADTNQDGEVNVLDIVIIVSLILN